MHRRNFLAAAAAFAAGCGRKPTTTPATVVSPGDLARIQSEAKAREQHFELLQHFRVEPTATRTTPKPPTDVLTTFPELKSRIKVTVRLHPRYSDEPKPDESKFGGRFLWPTDEPWPTCEEHGITFEPVLQLRQEDAPPNFAFPPDTDLMQLLWCPRDHLTPKLVWRKRAVVTVPADPPSPEQSFAGYVPVPCRLFPERVTEFPPSGLMPESVRGKFAALPDYDEQLAATFGTKAGGYPRGLDPNANTACDQCRWPMDFLLTVSASEWTDTNWKRWMPTEELPKRSAEGDQGYGKAAGLMLTKPVNVYICRRCEGWPVRTV